MPVSPLHKPSRSGKQEQDIRETLAQVTPDVLTQAYMEKKLSLFEYEHWMKEKARLELDGALRNDGFAKGLWNEAVKQAAKHWISLVKDVQGIASPAGMAASENKSNPAFGGTWNEDHGRLYYASMALWNMVMLPVSQVLALEHVSANKLENMALQAGATPGLAHLYGIAGSTPVGFVAIGLGIRTAAKGLQAGAAAVDKIRGVGSATAAEGMAVKAVLEGLEIEGVKEATKVVGDAAKAVGKTLPKDLPDFVESFGSKKIPKLIDKTLRQNTDEIIKRATKETAETELPALMKKFGITLSDAEQTVLLGGRQVLTSKQLYGHLKMLEAHSDKLPGLAKRALAGGPAEQRAFMAYVNTLFTHNPSKSVLGTKNFTDLLMHWNPAAIARGDIAGAMRSFAEDIAVMNHTSAAKLTFGSQEGFIKFGSLWGGIRELYFNILLPFSWGPSFIGNAYATSMHVMERATGTMFMAGGPAQGAHAALSETVISAKATQLAFGDAIKAFGQAYNKMDAQEMAAFVAANGSRLDYIPNQIPGTIGRIINAFGTSPTLGMDNFWKVIDRRIVLYENALKSGLNLGLTGRVLGRHVNGQVMHPGFYVQNYQAMETTARQLTFQSEMGWIMKRLQPIIQYGPGVLYFPFVKTGVNVMKHGWDRTPILQLTNRQLYKDIIAGGTAADDAVGRLILSNFWGHFMFELAKDGYITGGGPLNPKVKPSWDATHQAYSWTTPKGFVSYDNQDPITAPIGFIADFAEISSQLDDPNGGKVATAITVAMLRNFPNRTWWQTGSNIIDQIQRVKEGKPVQKFGEQQALAPLITGVTGGAVGTRLARIMDPVQRETRTLTDMVKARVPNWSKTLPAKTDAYGDDIIVPEPAYGPSWFGAFGPLAPKFKPAATDRIKLEGDRLSVKTPRFPFTVGGRTRHLEDDLGDFDVLPLSPGETIGVDLSAQEQYTWKKEYKKMLRDPQDGLEAILLNTPDYKDSEQMPDPLRGVTFEGLLKTYRNAAWKKVLSESPVLFEKAMRAKAATMGPKIGNVDERQKFMQDIELEIGAMRGMSQQERFNLQNQDHTLEQNIPPIELPQEVTDELH